MHDIPDRMADALRGQYNWHLDVDVFDHDGAKLLENGLPVSSGSITWDLRQQGGAAKGSIVVPDYSYVPTSIYSPLAPFGHHLRIRVGISDDLSAPVDWVNYGQFIITTTKVSRPDGGIRVDFIDLAWQANETVLEGREVRTFKQGGNLESIIDGLMEMALGYKVGVDGADGILLKRDFKYDRGTSYWAIIRDLCDRHGHDVVTQGAGGLRLVDRGLGGQVAERLNTGEEILSLDSEVNRLKVVNKVIVIHKGTVKVRRADASGKQKVVSFW